MGLHIYFNGEIKLSVFILIVIKMLPFGRSLEQIFFHGSVCMSHKNELIRDHINLSAKITLSTNIRFFFNSKIKYASMVFKNCKNKPLNLINLVLVHRLAN